MTTRVDMLGGPDGPEATTAGRAALSGQLLRRQVIQYAPGVLLPAIVSIATAAIFTRTFDSVSYGRFSLAWSVATVAVLLLSQWLHQGIARFVPSVAPGEATVRLKAAICLAVLGVLGVTALLAATALGVAALRLSPEWARIAAGGVAMVVATSAFGPLGAVVQSEMRASRYSAFVVATSVARLGFALLLVFAVARDPASLLWAQALALGLALPLLWRDAGLPAVAMVVGRRAEWWPTVRQMATYGVPLVGFTVAGTLLDLSDRWVIQYFRGAGEVGIYAANYSLVFGTIGLVALPMLLATHPFLMRAWESGDRAAASRWLGKIVEWYVIAGALVVGVIGFYSRDIATLVLGAPFRPGHRIIPVVLAGMIVWQLGMYSHKPLEFTGRTSVMFQVAVGVTLLNLLGNLLVVPRFGYMGAAYTSLGAYVLYTVIVTRIGRRILPWTVRAGRVAASLLLVAGGLLLMSLVRTLVDRRYGAAAGLAASGIVALATVSAVIVRDALPLLRPARPSG